MVDHKYQEESEDGSNANLNPQDEWSHNLVEPGQTVYWELESDTPDIDGIYYERKMINYALLGWTLHSNFKVKEARGETPIIRIRFASKEKLQLSEYDLRQKKVMNCLKNVLALWLMHIFQDRGMFQEK